MIFEMSTPPFERPTRELNALYRVSQILGSAGDRRQMLSAILDVLNEELAMPRGTLTLVSPEGDELLREVTRHPDAPQGQTARIGQCEGTIRRVIETGQPAVVLRASQEAQTLAQLRRREPAPREFSFLCVPLTVGGQVIGTLSAERTYDETAPLDEDLRVLTILGGMIANDVRLSQKISPRQQELEEENLRLHAVLEDRFRPENIIGASNAMRGVYQVIHQACEQEDPVLIRGEAGTGKELVAQAIHYSGPRAKGPFIRINCAAMSEGMLESELFGLERGAFTGALQSRMGRIAAAERGTLFLDGVGDLALATQIKLLRLIQEHEFKRVGGNETLKADARLIVATPGDLEQSVVAGRFREDLYYRLTGLTIYIPPLRDRRDDIMLLADHFVEKHARKLGKEVRRISTPAIDMLAAYHWPGNVRELENCIERAVLLSAAGVIHGHHLPPTLQTPETSDTFGEGTLEQRVDQFERDILTDALKCTHGNVNATARKLGSTVRIVRYKIKNLGIGAR